MKALMEELFSSPRGPQLFPLVWWVWLPNPDKATKPELKQLEFNAQQKHEIIILAHNSLRLMMKTLAKIVKFSHWLRQVHTSDAKHLIAPKQAPRQAR